MQFYTSRKKSEQNGFAEEFARDIEFREGRQDVKVKMEIDICTELAAADLIKSGALDHLLEGMSNCLMSSDQYLALSANWTISLLCVPLI
jgi:hypothetical protein